ncbi:MAG TPA: cupin domain-containing protein [Pseudogracilibacillus sp.]|nr:cupin domain-containing protein [Pseudogracilibacillus sp.]
MEYVDIWHDVSKKDRYANRVMKKDKFDVVHIHLKKGEEMGSHHAKEETLIIVRNGRVEFTVEGKTVELTNESILQMDPYEKHDLKAIEETDLFLLKFK